MAKKRPSASPASSSSDPRPVTSVPPAIRKAAKPQPQPGTSAKTAKAAPKKPDPSPRPEANRSTGGRFVVVGGDAVVAPRLRYGEFLAMRRVADEENYERREVPSAATPTGLDQDPEGHGTAVPPADDGVTDGWPRGSPAGQDLERTEAHESSALAVPHEPEAVQLPRDDQEEGVMDYETAEALEHGEFGAQDVGFDPELVQPRGHAPAMTFEAAAARGRVDECCFSHFVPSEANVATSADGSTMAVALKFDESLVFQGYALARIFSGRVRVFGMTLPPSGRFAPFYSLSTHALLKFEVAPAAEDAAMPDAATADQEDDPAVDECVRKLDVSSFGAVLVFKELVRDDLVHVKLIAKLLKWPQHLDDPLFVLPNFAPVLRPVLGVLEFLMPDRWSYLMSTLLSRSCEKPLSVLVCGPKNAGKTTFARILLNQLVQRHGKVVFLETDVGQCEFTPSGLVSLHVVDEPVFGPSYTHQRTPTRSYFVGTTTPKQDPEHYVGAVRALWQLYLAEFATQGVPVVVNTQGWVKGLGEELLREVVRVVQPDYAVELVSRSPTKNLAANWADRDREVMDYFGGPASTELHEQDTEEEVADGAGADWQYGIADFHGPPRLRRLPAAPLLADSQFIQIASCPPSPFALASTSTDLRTLSFLTYFNTGTPLLEQPYKVTWSSVGVCMLPDAEAAPAECLRLLNASVVGLLTDASRSHESAPGTMVRAEDGAVLDCPRLVPSSMGVASPPPPCLGLGVVRSVDAERRLFFVATPVPEAALQGVNLLCRGRLDLPLALFLRGRQDDGPYLSPLSAGGLGGRTRKPRQNLIRRYQLGGGGQQ